MEASSSTGRRVLAFVAGLVLAHSAAVTAAALTLEEAVRTSLATSPVRAAAAARSEAAEANLRQAGRLPNPSFELQAENLTVGDWPTGASLDPDVFALLSQPVEIGGDRSARRRHAAAQRDEAEAARRRSEREIAIDTARCFLATLQARTLSGLLDENRRELETLAEALSRRVDDGVAPEGDLMKLRTEIGRLDLQHARVDADLAGEAGRLAALLGLDAVDPQQLELPADAQHPAGPKSGEIPETSRRPELDVARAHLAAADRLLDVERARRIPDINLVAGYKRTESLDTLVAGFAVPLPVFDRNADNVARAAAERRAAAAELQALEREMQTETAARLARAATLSQRARRSRDELLEPSRIARDATRVAFREGAASVLQLVDAERTYTDVLREVLDLQMEAIRETYVLEWTPEEILP